MRAASKRRGIEITSISRPIRPSDFRDFDIILAMDNQNRKLLMGGNLERHLLMMLTRRLS
ncbi:LOW MOLECULAR WEIGHT PHOSPHOTYROSINE PROTEIN PHOSPHATASE-RELATED [Salix koriyanagi]|uniref:LOW MOLECULAR WEIGHT PHOSPHOTYROSINE PROTEIN PHOSPHATASE-RELATED n=1 Tax=Salix koriyanagi TaxID=2511006 RepID=A0A9Q0ZM45_9ROSI|nr:LOW MOLECULAR WEIGHT PHOSPHOTYROSINE PROTEIN PHOSPHATASE-RELATED [Salix koriyanagi]